MTPAERPILGYVRPAERDPLDAEEKALCGKLLGTLLLVLVVPVALVGLGLWLSGLGEWFVSRSGRL